MTPHMSVGIPRGWPTRSDSARGIVIAAQAPRRGSGDDHGHVAIALRAVAVPDAGLDSWRRRALAELASTTDGFCLEDDDHYELAGLPARYHRFAHRCDGVELISEQWCWWVDGVGISVSCSVATEQYLFYSELFEDVAASLEIDPPAVAAVTSPAAP